MNLTITRTITINLPPYLSDAVIELARQGRKIGAIKLLRGYISHEQPENADLAGLKECKDWVERYA